MYPTVERYAGSPFTVVPSTTTEPASGRTRPRMVLIRVDLPAAFGPIRAVMRRGWIVRLTRSSTVSRPNRWLRPATSTTGNSGLGGRETGKTTGASAMRRTHQRTAIDHRLRRERRDHPL